MTTFQQARAFLEVDERRPGRADPDAGEPGAARRQDAYLRALDPAKQLECEPAAVERPRDVQPDGPTAGVLLERQLAHEADLGARGRCDDERHGYDDEDDPHHGRSLTE